MDKQEWTPKLGEDFWILGLPDYFNPPELILYRRNDTVDWLHGMGRSPERYPTRDQAKAALIKKLEDALEEAKRL